MKHNFMIVRQDILLILGMCAILLGSYFIMHPSTQVEFRSTERIMVQKGDTLWTIAQRVTHDSVDIRYYIHKVKELNHLADEGTLRPGMILEIPKVTNGDTEFGSTYMAQK